MLTEKEISRYSRHLLLSEIGKAGQEKLKNSMVLVIGAGGLGCPVLMYLAAAGVGKIGIVDFDKVDESNLQRQILFDIKDVGKLKADVARHKLSAQNPFVGIESITQKLSVQNALELFSGYDIIVDGTDNFSTRYLVNDACVLLEKILVSGSIFKFQGQVSVFNLNVKSPTYRCLFPSAPPAESSPACSEVGVMGVLPGIIGSLMANEVIKIIVGIGELLSGKVLLVDALSMNFSKIELTRNPGSEKAVPQNENAFRKMDYDLFCGIKNNINMLKEISAEELSAMISAKENIQLLDVREINEMPEAPASNALKIPLGEIEKYTNKIDRDKKVIVFCRMGGRSRKAIEALEKHGFQNLYNLKGGVMEWLKTTK